jgi:hypothetical protein
MYRDSLPAIGELAALVESRAVEAKPGARLRVAIELSRELNDASDALLERFVSEARSAGLTWTDIGQAFGTSKQAAQQRYGAAGDDPGQWPGRWTPSARAALNRAGAEARALGHDYLGTEHVLLALASGEGRVAGEVLRDLGVERERMLATSCLRAGTEHGTRQACVSVMPRLKQALESSLRIADALHAPLADTEHLLACVVSVPDSMAVEILRRLGISVTDVRAALSACIGVEPQLLGAPRRRRRRLLAAR